MTELLFLYLKATPWFVLKSYSLIGFLMLIVRCREKTMNAFQTPIEVSGEGKSNST